MPEGGELEAFTVEEMVEAAIQDISPEDVHSPALRRLIEDVRENGGPEPTLYNRTHNRHNRSR